MDQVQGKHFSITDPQNVNTVIYQINKTEGLMEENTPKFTLERLKCREELVGLNKRKTFFVDAPKDEGNQLIILSFGQDRVVVNMGLLNKDEVKISKRPVPVKFNTLYSEQETEYKDVRYNGDANVRAFYTDWGTRGILDIVLERDVKVVPEKKQEYEEFFKSQAWNEFDEEQIKLEKDTLHLCII